ncbi:hypothetical protein [Pseudodesulfovibrio indicus]|uniref:hypothetical protein n=1 Tax=Pseudodesulfovibrio indicus TaxID=1716143 RepID=UPI0029309C63|nr:hypothetical protein [Pseudodesulfovibrio indicus]
MSDVPDGYMADTGAEWSYQNGHWYGWANAENNFARVNPSGYSGSVDDTLDSGNEFIYTAADDTVVDYLWHFDVPSSNNDSCDYYVTIQAGGANYIGQQCVIYVEDEEVINALVSSDNLNYCLKVLSLFQTVF